MIKLNTLIMLLILLTACTNISITMVRTEGTATDVVDSEQSPKTDATVSPAISIPASVIQ